MDEFLLTVSSNWCTGNFAARSNVFLPTFVQFSAEYEVALTYVRCPDTIDVNKAVCIQSDLVRS